jgi:hypothetical protein
MESKLRIKQLAERFEQLRNALRLSNKRFALRFKRYLKSEKQWVALRDDKWEGYLNPERALHSLEGMAASLDGGAPVETFFDILPFAQRMDAELERLLGTTTDRLCLVVLAATGAGKSVWGRRRASDDPETSTYTRARPTWRENQFAILQGLSRDLGCPLEKSPRAQMDKLIDSLRGGQRRNIIIDEAHDGGVALLKVIKALIDETGSRFVYMAYPTEFDRVRSVSEGAVAEARQLLGRAQKPIFDDYRHGVQADDVEVFLAAAAGIQKDAKAVAEEMLPLVRGNGNLRVLADAIEEARDEADDKPITARMVHEALCCLCKARPEERKKGKE